MALDSRYISISDLQLLLRDKDSGQSLAAGVLYFYQDNARTVPKSVFILSGSPPNYSYTDIGNEITLSAAGTFQYLGNDVTPFYFPYVDEDDGADIELYYVECYSEGGKTSGVLQWTREAVPYIVAETTTQTDFTNYVSNGQFLLHNNLPKTLTEPLYDTGEIRAPVTQIAPGGWQFVRDSMAASKDFVLFERLDAISENPTANPRYYARIRCETPAAGTAKDLRLQFKNVNQFASNTQEYTIALTGQSNTGSNVVVQLFIVKNFGTGGSNEEIISKGNLLLTNTFSIVSQSFTFGLNDTQTLGTLDDDYVEIAFRFPPEAVFDVSVTDFVLTPGRVSVNAFPQTPDAQFKYRSIAGFMPVPDYDGLNAYLPLVLTPQGLTFDDSEVGRIYASISENTPVGSLKCDGTKYETAAYSTEGIPYVRLQKKLFIETGDIAVPRFGTGDDYLTAVYEGANALRVVNNAGGAVTATADGSTPTGFTFSVIHTGVAVGYYVDTYYESDNTFWIINQNPGAVVKSEAGTSGFSVTNYQQGNSVLKNMTIVETVNTSLAGKHFTFESESAGVHAYFVWFKVDGSGTIPNVPGRTAILVDLIGTDTPAIIAQKIQEALKGAQSSLILTTAASALSGGEFFTMSATGDDFYVWLTKDGVGVDPKPGGRISIQVDLLSSDTNAEVAKKIQKAINSKYFRIVNLENAYLSGHSANHLINPRLSSVPGLNGAQLGSYQFDENKSKPLLGTIQGGLAAGSEFFALENGVSAVLNSGFMQGNESPTNHPENYSVNFYIKY